MKDGKLPQETGDKAGQQQGKDKSRVPDTNSPRTGNQAEQVKVWEEEGGSPPEQISSTNSVKPKTGSKTGAMGPAKD